MGEYVNIILLFVFGAVISGGFIVISYLLGPSNKSAAKGMPYECGVDPVGEPRRQFTVKFCLVAMIFIVFDIEVVFLYPWAVLFKEFKEIGMGVFAFIEMMVFVGILAVGLLYVYGRRAIDWE